MYEKDKLRYLVDGLLNDLYEIGTFCDEFTRIYNLELDYDELTNEENVLFGELAEMAGRFSDDVDELMIPNMYCNKEEIIEKARISREQLGWHI